MSQCAEIGLAIALDPLPLTAFLVVLPSKRGVRTRLSRKTTSIHATSGTVLIPFG